MKKHSYLSINNVNIHMGQNKYHYSSAATMLMYNSKHGEPARMIQEKHREHTTLWCTVNLSLAKRIATIHALG